MARVTVELPSILVPVAGVSSFALEASTLAELFEILPLRRPELRVHLFDEKGGLRRHVLCLHNGANSRWRNGAEVALADGDEIRFLQAVSGG